jgi:hypothetical protein
MSASATMPTPPPSLAGEAIPQPELAYYRERLRNRVFDCILDALGERVRTRRFNRLMIARRMGKDPAQVSRLLAYPSNLTLDTVSDLLRALDADLTLSFFLTDQAPPANYEHPWSTRNDKAEMVPDINDMRRAEPATASPPNPVLFRFEQTKVNDNG